MATPPNLQVVWFKRDLRISDHSPLAIAAQHGPVLPLYIVEPEFWVQPDSADRHWHFLKCSLSDLNRQLCSIGQPLVIRTGEARAVLNQLHQQHGIAALWSHEETGNGWTYQRDLEVAAWAREHGLQWHETAQTGVIRRLGSRDGWARRWDKLMAQPTTPVPESLAPIDVTSDALPETRPGGWGGDAAQNPQAGGRDDALQTLNGFLLERGRGYRKEMSSPVTAFASCSRLSPYLAFGCLSMREVAQATWNRQRELKQLNDRSGWRGSMSSFQGRLHWHCHFMQKLEDAPNLEFEELHPAYRGFRPEISDQARLEAWCKGETGLPFVDACMRALIATGWMNFRMRAMLMAVASYHLWLPWRETGLHLARMFTDYEPGIHWPQVQMQSGTTGINTVRIYNPVKQGYDQDPRGEFVRHWVPELAHLPDSHIHEPWNWDQASSLLDKTYPAQIIDHKAAAKMAREKIYGIRKGKEFRDEANAIQEKHGSRKSGMPMTGQRRVRRKTPPKDQLALEL